jgi:ubiquinone/menaquinone biosynthesis C-methylase UbiE
MRLITAFAALFLLTALCAVAGDEPEHHHGKKHPDKHDATMHHSFDDVQKWIDRFDDPKRNEWQKPDTVLAVITVESGDRIADIGAGTGYFTIPLARAVGAEGMVYGVDIESSMVKYLGERAKKEGLAQIKAVLTRPDAPGIDSSSVDLVFICDTWHHIDDRLVYLEKLKQALRPGGRVAIVDFKEGDLPVGPPAGHKLTDQDVIAEFAAVGMKLLTHSDDLPYQYILIFGVE